MTGRQLLHYRLEEKLGEGGMGAVFRATDTRIGRAVAIKVIRSDRLADPSRVRQFLREAQAASALRHPNIVHVHGLSHDDGVDFLVMELLSGRTLADRIPPRGLPIGELFSFAEQIAAGISAAHSAGIVHRDLKPSNIVITDAAEAKIVDFGLAKLTGPPELSPDPLSDTDAAPDTLAGTFPYMSPEQAEGKPVDARSDIFSFGALLYEMASGRRAFPGDSPAAIVSAILRREPPRLRAVRPRLPRALEAVVARCLRKDIDRRFQNMADVRIAITEARAGRIPKLPMSWPALRPWALAAACVVATAVGVLAIWRSGARPPAPMVLPLTGYGGQEIYPAWSPDGRFVAFSWTPEPQPGQPANSDIYIVEAGAGHAPRRFTTSPEREIAPAWSPDGKSIAFLRYKPKASVMIAPSEGGEARELVANVRGAPSWSPDGRWLLTAIDEPSGLRYRVYAISLDSHERRPLTSPPAAVLGDREAVVAPDRKSFAFVRVRAWGLVSIFQQDLDARFFPKGEPRRVTTTAFAGNPHWTPDGRDLLYSAGPDAGISLWRIRPGSRTAVPLPFEGGRLWSPVVARFAGRQRLAFNQTVYDTSIWRIPMPGVSGQAVNLINSSFAEDGMDYSPDGRKIVFASGRSGHDELWVSNSDGASAEQITRISRQAGAPRWSPAGEWIVFDARVDDGTHLFVVRPDGSALRQLTRTGDNLIPSWSRDGRFVLFTKRFESEYRAMRISLEGVEEPIAPVGSFEPVESWDRSCLYYSAWGRGLVRRHLATSKETLLIPSERVDVGIAAPGGLLRIEGREEIRFYPDSSAQGATLGKLPRRLAGTFALSPDAKALLFTTLESERSDIMWVDGFR